MLTLGDLGYMGTSPEIPLKASRKHSLSKEQKDHTAWHARLRIDIEHSVFCMKKFETFADTHCNNRPVNTIAKKTRQSKFENSVAKWVGETAAKFFTRYCESGLLSALTSLAQYCPEGFVIQEKQNCLRNHPRKKASYPTRTLIRSSTILGSASVEVSPNSA
ncbi:MAG: hypothetical protein HRT36_08980 [Alphaproteobacteria bacterium]|nr:hypothetical protein [Alphaproteobacteria bacterium]